jgi:hypothetical protein
MIAAELTEYHAGRTLVRGKNSKKKRHVIQHVEKNASMVIVHTKTTKRIPLILDPGEEIGLEA